MRGVRIACGGLGPLPRRFPDIERALAGLPVPSRQSDREELEALIAPFIHPLPDLRGGLEFKRRQAAVLITSAILEAAP